MQNQIAIQMDNIETIDYEFDTSFLIGYEAQNRNYKIFYYNPKDLLIDNGNILATGYYLKLNLDQNNYYKYTSNKTRVELKNFSYVFLRQDPPFNMNYITSTYILDLLPKTVTDRPDFLTSIAALKPAPPLPIIRTFEIFVKC